jgi:hypothetical protein
MSGSEELFERITMNRIPTLKRRSVPDNILGGSRDAAFVDGARRRDGHSGQKEQPWNIAASDTAVLKFPKFV